MLRNDSIGDKQCSTKSTYSYAQQQSMRLSLFVGSMLTTHLDGFLKKLNRIGEDVPLPICSLSTKLCFGVTADLIRFHAEILEELNITQAFVFDSCLKVYTIYALYSKFRASLSVDIDDRQVGKACQRDYDDYARSKLTGQQYNASDDLEGHWEHTEKGHVQDFCNRVASRSASG